MRRWLWFVVPFAAIVGAGIVVRVWFASQQIASCEEHDPAVIDDLDLDQPCVVVQGQAHYDVVVRQRIPGNLFLPEQQRYLFPLFPSGDTSDRAIRVLVMTEREPERLVSFETMAVSGRLVPATAREVPYDVEIKIGRSGDYFFTDGLMLLVPDRIEADGEVWHRSE